MRKILLTSSQVSVLASSGIAILFTLALFLAGYTLQQRTLHSLQASLKPRHPPAPRQNNAPAPTASSRIAGPPGSSAHIAYTSYLTPSREINWSAHAHVQLVSTHHDVCSAIMLLGDLHRLRSPAQRVLLFPRAWAVDKNAEKGAVVDPYLATTRRLLKHAVRRFGVELRPIVPTEGSEEEGTAVYGLSALWGLGGFERVMMVKTPGMVLDATPLDAVLGYAPVAGVGVVAADAVKGVGEGDLLLVAPDKMVYEGLRDLNSSDIVGVKERLDSIVLDSEEGERDLVMSMSTLQLPIEGDAFNATAWLDGAAYVTFEVDEMPGPEYDIPYAQRVAARPANKDADWVWTKLYGNFAQRRMDVCGLDLETWYGDE